MKKQLLLSTFAALLVAITNAQVNPLLTTTWNQGCNYNAQCPTTGSGGACGRVWTGCNATAIAQIFKYYAYPTTGMSSHCNTNNTSHCANFSTSTYNYSLMPNNVTSANAEVAQLMYHLGIVVDMQWSGTSSNSFFTTTPFLRYFAYSPRIYATANFMFNTTADLIAAIKNELDHGRPVFAKGGNHFYLIDGYNTSSQFHCNFGWGGVYDGYYAITNVVNGAGNFTPTNYIFNIKPLSGDLETATDTIIVPATANANHSFAFTSKLNWTLSTSQPWLATNLSNGTPGYYDFNDGNKFSVTTNNGGVRYGYIFIQNQNDVDTIVVQQDASPLVVTPVNLNFIASGGTQTVSVNYYSWGNWTVMSPDTWINLSPASGTGNGTFNVTASNNPNSTPRNGIAIVTAGQFTDTVFIHQDGNLTTGIFHNTETVLWNMYPNPATDFIYIDNTTTNSNQTLLIVSTSGQVIKRITLSPALSTIDVSDLKTGIYFVMTENHAHTTPIKLSIVR